MQIGQWYKYGAIEVSVIRINKNGSVRVRFYDRNDNKQEVTVNPLDLV